MFWLGLLTTTVYVPGYTGAAIQTGWAALSIILPWTLWKEATITPFHYFGLVFLAYAALAALWAPNFWDGLWVLWLLSMMGLAFRLGSAVPNLRSLYHGLALGLTISSAVAIAQWYGYQPVLSFVLNRPSGLLFNSTVLGAACALVIIGLVRENLWRWIPGLLPGLILAQSRGAWVVLAIGLTACANRKLWPPLVVGAIAMLAVLAFGEHGLSRWDIWRFAISHTYFFGSGPGSFESYWWNLPGVGLKHLEFVHNDYLDLLFQFGIGALALFYLLFTLALESSRERPVLIAFLSLAAFYFPIQSTTLALVGACVAGHIARDLHLAWARRDNRGPNLVSSRANAQIRLSIAGRAPVPAELGATT